jgi:hypothetical protein
MKLIHHFMFGALCFSSLALAEPVQTISADNQQYLYTGRIDFADKKAPSISWAGTSIKANFTGT